MATLVIFGVVSSVAIKKYANISVSAELRALDVGISELNTRETLTWANLIIAQGNFPGDEVVWTVMTAYTEIGSSYKWASGPDREAGGNLRSATKSFRFNGTPPLCRWPQNGTSPQRNKVFDEPVGGPAPFNWQLVSAFSRECSDAYL